MNYHYSVDTSFPTDHVWAFLDHRNCFILTSRESSPSYRSNLTSQDSVIRTFSDPTSEKELSYHKRKQLRHNYAVTVQNRRMSYIGKDSNNLSVQ